MRISPRYPLGKSTLLLVLTTIACDDSSPTTPSAPPTTSETIVVTPSDEEDREVPTSEEVANPYIPAPTIGDPWSEWGVGQFNGTTAHSSSHSLVITFGPTTAVDVLMQIFRPNLEQRGWSVTHQWTDGPRHALSMARDDDRFCLLFSPPPEEEVEPQTLVVAEIPGPNARAGHCEEGTSLAPLLLAEIRNREVVELGEPSGAPEVNNEALEPIPPREP